MKIDPDQAFADAIRDVMRCYPCLRLDLSWETAIAVIASLQLSLRHPANNGPTAARIRELLDNVIGGIEQASPTLAMLLRMGDDPQHDR